VAKDKETEYATRTRYSKHPIKARCSIAEIVNYHGDNAVISPLVAAPRVDYLVELATAPDLL
jgi:hypothetical protein